MGGESESGDGYVVLPIERGALIAVMDGLGHGHAAASATRAAVEILERNPSDPIISLIERCHAALRETRGVAMTIASVAPAEGTVTWAGVGNVEARLLRAKTDSIHHDAALLLGGVVGYNLPSMRSTKLTLEDRDLLVFATDGISAAFADDIVVNQGPTEIARSVLSKYRKEDDALVLAARYFIHRE
jgi:serine/threonine protein phosphatase PrpC